MRKWAWLLVSMSLVCACDDGSTPRDEIDQADVESSSETDGSEGEDELDGEEVDRTEELDAEEVDSVDGAEIDGVEELDADAPEGGDTPDLADPCATVLCAEWERCVDGLCELAPGRCADTTDCAAGEDCPSASHVCVPDGCSGLDCGQGGVCSLAGDGGVVCNCPNGYMDGGGSCVADTAPAIHWCNLQWPLSIAGAVGDPAVNVYSQLYVNSDPGFNTPFASVPAGLRAQLGRGAQAPSYPVIATELSWTEASFNAACGACGDNNEFSAPFALNVAGTFHYLFRYSLNDGQSWTYCDLNGKVVGPPNAAVAQITGGSTCGGNVCADWQLCSNDQCETAPGRCATTSDCSGVEVCNLATHTCQGSGGAPLLTLVAQPTLSPTGYSLQVQYTGALPIDFAASRTSLNGQLVDLSPAYDAATGLFSISASGLAQGKYSYLFRVVDSAGARANELYLPMWIEATPFAWRDMFLYQVMTDRFADGSDLNDAPVSGVDTAANWQGGDFAGLIDQIENGYFTTLGVNVLWISSPILNTDGAGRGLGDPNRYFSAYHSYWPIATGWTDQNPLPGITSPIDPHFGSAEELEELVRVAHAHGLRVIADFVANHVYGITNGNDAYGSTAPLWDNRPSNDWFNSATNPYICGWDQPITCWFTNYLPDLNYDQPAVMTAVIDHAIWMAQEFDLDGFRLDAVKHMPMSFTTTMRARIQQDLEQTGVPFYTVGETYDGDKGMLGAYVGSDKLTGQFEFGFYFSAKANVLNGTNLGALKGLTDERDTYYQNSVWSGALMPYFIGNHDVTRAFSEAGNDAGRVRAALTILLTSPPPPLLYQGDEICEPGGADPDNRHMMRFSGLQGYETETKSWVAKLGVFRKNHVALRGGTRTTCAVGSDTWTYQMSRDGETVLVGINRSGNPLSLACGLSGGYVDQDGNTGTLPATVPAWSNLVLVVQ